MRNPIAFIQVDIDGLWAVRRCYGKPERGTFEEDPVWEAGVPRLAEWFARHDVRGSFFVVGRDMELESKRAAARVLASAGHEIANHSYMHRIGLTRLPAAAIDRELQRTHEAILAAGLPAPVGFRAPGYDVDEKVFRAVGRMGYQYDASMLPTRLGPLLRVADAVMARRWQSEKSQFGRWRYGGAPREPYLPDSSDIVKVFLRSRTWASNPHKPVPRGVMELPVTTLPPWGLPFTASSIFALGPQKVMDGLKELRRRGAPLLWLLHGIDMVDCRKPIVFDTRVVRAGGFSISAQEKLRMLEPVMRFVKENYEAVVAREWVGG